MYWEDGFAALCEMFGDRRYDPAKGMTLASLTRYHAAFFGHQWCHGGAVGTFRHGLTHAVAFTRRAKLRDSHM